MTDKARGTMIPIGGTRSWREIFTGNVPNPDWTHPGSPFQKTMEEDNVHIYDPNDPYVWSTDISGILFQSRRTWKAPGWNLKQYCEHKGIPLYLRMLALHSHAWQLFLYALYYGLEVNNVVAVAPPIRLDVLRDVGLEDDVTLQGGPLRLVDDIFTRVHGRILIITDPGDDKTRRMGEWFDGRKGEVRGLGHGKVNVHYVPGCSHSKIFHESHFREAWKANGWTDWFRPNLATETPPSGLRKPS
jgi:hypothetical protein